MAESAVTFVLEKLTVLLEEKVNLVKNVRQEVEYIRDELERMIAFIGVADAAEDDDPELKVWVKQVRDVAYDTEDIIDDFMLQFSLESEGFLRKLIFSIRNLRTRYKIAFGIQNIKSRIKDIAEGHSRYSYKFDAPGEVLSSQCVTTRGIDPQGDALLLEEAELVGIENPRRQIIRWLVEGESRLKVVSVVGMGGLGKTTLVKKVYDDFVVKKHFQNHAWIIVSQSFEVDELLKDTIQQLFEQMKRAPPQNLSTMDGNRLKAIIKDFLRGRRYVLVFDDVWSILTWEAIRHALPNENNGSRVILTTRVMDVAFSCSKETDGYVYELNPLSEEQSWILFCQKTFRGNQCPSHLIEICKNILKRCGGLPLAIVAISGVLSTKKEINVDEWKMLNCRLGSELEGIVPLVPDTSQSNVVCPTLISPKGIDNLCNHALCKETLGNWNLILPTVQIAYNNSANRSLSLNPFEVVHSYKCRRSSDLISMFPYTSVSMLAEAFARHLHDLHIEINKQLDTSNALYKLQADLHNRHFEFNIGNYVILQARNAGPYKILKHVSSNTYVVDLLSYFAIPRKRHRLGCFWTDLPGSIVELKIESWSVSK
ncbi:disease resistance RPM1-like [Olea europaea subsp. europaea]|uniref:Disease resistance RPM1-like n=1 Tax=Olea europaea subsp. europaea TaxID=158383 RepID=A0A8S0PXH6_OLEEU|nr:disease resistance RPM1-like [Olea europaea subsp. europaea]